MHRRPSAYTLRSGPEVVASEVPIELASRGERMFGELFSVPFGPRSYDAFSHRDQLKTPEVFGLTETDTIRAGYYMNEISRAAKRGRLRMLHTRSSTLSTRSNARSGSDFVHCAAPAQTHGVSAARTCHDFTLYVRSRYPEHRRPTPL